MDLKRLKMLSKNIYHKIMFGIYGFLSSKNDYFLKKWFYHSRKYNDARFGAYCLEKKCK